MTVQAKICGLNTPAAVDAALAGGAAAVGFNFYPPSARSLAPVRAAGLAERAEGTTRVGLFVDPDDRLLAEVTEAVPLELLQLHGAESPDRLAEIKARFQLPVMKAIKLAGVEDLGVVAAYEAAADWLLFDAKVPPGTPGMLPGGNGVPFDWRILAGRARRKPWMLSGGLTVDNVAEAVSITGAPWVDVSSGVETAPGEKSSARIEAFLGAVRAVAN